MIGTVTISQMADVFIVCLQQQNIKYQLPTKGMDIAEEEIQRDLCFVLKPEQFLNRVAPPQGGADRIQATYQILAEEHMRKQKDIIGDMLDLICV
jgi:hypothetical protein